MLQGDYKDYKTKTKLQKKMEQKKKIVKATRIEVVKELPVQSVRSYTEEDGTIVEYLTTEEALTKLLNNK